MKELFVLGIMYVVLGLLTISLFKTKHVTILKKTLKIIIVISSLLTIAYLGMNIKSIFTQLITIFKNNFLEIICVVMLTLLISDIYKRIKRKRKSKC